MPTAADTVLNRIALFGLTRDRRPAARSEGVDRHAGQHQQCAAELRRRQRFVQQQPGGEQPDQRYQQRQRRNPPGFIAPQQAAPQ